MWDTMVRSGKHWLFVMLLSASMAGCENWNALGNYDLTLVWREGNCSFMESSTLSFVVVHAPDNTLGVSGPNGTGVEGSVNQERNECIADIVLTLPPDSFMNLPIESVFQLHIVDDKSNGVLNGDGHVELGAPRNCAQLFLIGGSKTL